MNLKPTSINPAVTHRVQRFGFIKAVALSGLFTTGALALAYDPQFTEYKLSVPVTKATISWLHLTVTSLAY